MARQPDDRRTRPRKQPRQERAKNAVTAILDACREILRSEGYRAASTRTIAERAGVSIGSLYQYFPGKEAVVAAVAETAWRELYMVGSRTLATLEKDEPHAVIGRVMADVAKLVRADRALYATLLTDMPSSVQRAPGVVQAIDAFLDSSLLLAEVSFGKDTVKRTATERWLQAHMALGGITALAIADEERFDLDEMAMKLGLVAGRMSTKTPAERAQSGPHPAPPIRVDRPL